MRWLAPDAARSFPNIVDRLVLSDCYRSAESSLLAMSQKRGVQPPSFSAHGAGLAIDIDVGKSLRLGKFKTKLELDTWMAEHCWYCHRLDHKDGLESWHMGFLRGAGGGAGGVRPGERSTAPAAERQLLTVYGAGINPTPEECQEMLAKLRFYSGAIDGRIGPLSRAAVQAFQRAWQVCTTARKRTGTTEDGVLGPVTKRTLAFVALGAPVPSR